MPTKNKKLLVYCTKNTSHCILFWVKLLTINTVGHENSNKVLVPHVVFMVEESIVVLRRPHARIVKPRQWHITRRGLIVEKKFRRRG